MAKVIIEKQISLEELQQVIKNGFPSFFIVRNRFTLEIDAGKQGKFTVYLSRQRRSQAQRNRSTSKILRIYPHIPNVVAIILFVSIIGIIILVLLIKYNSTANEIANYVRMQCENLVINSREQSTIPDTCPQCKSPNMKRIKLCEWCGSQIC